MIDSPRGRPACGRRKFVGNTDRSNEPDHADGEPCPAAVTFVTTEHFTLRGARSSTISESTSRASVFLGAVSGGLIALGIEDLAYARRIAQLRDYYFDHAPELAGYLLNPAERLPTAGLGIGPWQQFVTVAGVVAAITAVLAGSAGGPLAAVGSRAAPYRCPPARKQGRAKPGKALPLGFESGVHTCGRFLARAACVTVVEKIEIGNGI